MLNQPSNIFDRKLISRNSMHHQSWNLIKI